MENHQKEDDKIIVKKDMEQMNQDIEQKIKTHQISMTKKEGAPYGEEKSNSNKRIDAQSGEEKTTELDDIKNSDIIVEGKDMGSHGTLERYELSIKYLAISFRYVILLQTLSLLFLEVNADVQRL